jgi:predicted SAM-dependent methyltransferase
MKILNLGCGYRKIKDAINIDIDPECRPDKICDINHLPYPDNSIDEIIMHHCLEHNDPHVLLKEVYRVAKPDCIIRIVVPYYNAPDAFRDPTHISFYHETTLNYFPYLKVITIKPQVSIWGRFVPKRLLFPLAHVFGNLITGLELEVKKNKRG